MVPFLVMVAGFQACLRIVRRKPVTIVENFEHDAYLITEAKVRKRGQTGLGILVLGMVVMLLFMPIEEGRMAYPASMMMLAGVLIGFGISRLASTTWIWSHKNLRPIFQRVTQR